MSKRIKDTDYLFLSSRIHVLETTLLNKERRERMLEAASDSDAVRVLVECGYPEMPVVDVDSVNNALAVMRDRVFEDLYAFAPDPKMIDVFKVKYDYHNAKALLKAEAMGTDPQRLLMDVGRYPVKELTEAVREKSDGGFSEIFALAVQEAREVLGTTRDPVKELTEAVREKSDGGFSEIFALAVQEAREVLGTTRDPQQSDFVLDKAYFREMEQLAQATGSEFLAGYVKAQVDVANLKSVVRVLRMKKNPEYLSNVLFEGGTIGADTLLQMAERGEKLEGMYGSTPYAAAAEEGQAAVAGGKLTAFERSCDNALMDYVAEAKYVPFGEQVLIGYLVAKESELTAVRIIMMGRLAGLSTDVIRERLRDAYV